MYISQSVSSFVLTGLVFFISALSSSMASAVNCSGDVVVVQGGVVGSGVDHTCTGTTSVEISNLTVEANGLQELVAPLITILPVIHIEVGGILIARNPKPLNDTGIDWGGNYPSGNNATCTGETIAAQDCSHGRDATHDDDSDGHAGFSFTKLDASGVDLPASASTWSCVRDNVTGITWEVKTDDGGMRDTDNTYTWYNPDPNTNNGSSGAPNGGSCTGSDCDTYSYVQAVNAQEQTLCGARDWRMPWREELSSILDYSRYNPAIDTAYFPLQRSWRVWSGSAHAGRLHSAWLVYFNDGRSDDAFRDFSQRVRLVRTGQ